MRNIQVSIVTRRNRHRKKTTYELVVTHHCHNRQRFHAILARVKKRLLVEHDVWVNVGVEVRDAVALHGVLEGCLAVARRIVGAVASLVVSAVAVHIHVVVAVGALEKDGIGDVAAEDGVSGALAR